MNSLIVDVLTSLCVIAEVEQVDVAPKMNKALVAGMALKTKQLTNSLSLSAQGIQTHRVSWPSSARGSTRPWPANILTPPNSHFCTMTQSHTLHRTPSVCKVSFFSRASKLLERAVKGSLQFSVAEVIHTWASLPYHTAFVQLLK